jgi:hypothetical protein
MNIIYVILTENSMRSNRVFLCHSRTAKPKNLLAQKSLLSVCFALIFLGIVAGVIALALIPVYLSDKDINDDYTKRSTLHRRSSLSTSASFLLQ